VNPLAKGSTISFSIDFIVNPISLKPSQSFEIYT